MLITLTLITLALLATVVYQDLRFRAVTWIIFPALLMLNITRNSFENSFRNAFENLLLNCIFIFAMILIVYIYFTLKGHSLTFITKDYLGWGDILFFVSIAPSFPVPYFIFYLISGLLFVLLLFLLYRLVNPGFDLNKYRIPLAGLMAVWFILFTMIETVFPQLFSDSAYLFFN